MNELKIVKQQLPVLEIKDYELIKTEVESDVALYENYTVTEETLEKDTKTRAELNNKAKSFNQRRLDIQKELTKPIDEFKNKVDYLVNMYKKASESLDVQIKNFEQKTKDDKKKEIEILFNNNIKELKSIITLDLIFDEKWLNKTTKLDTVEKEIQTKFNKIKEDMIAITNLKSKHELALNSLYLKTFDLGQVIVENNRLNELESKVEKVEVAKEEIKQEEVKEMMTKEVVVEEDDPIKNYTLSIKGELSKIKALRKFMELNNIEFKLEEK